MQGEINIAIGATPPASYFGSLRRQCESEEARYGGIIDFEELDANLKLHCMPDGMEDTNIEGYDEFLEERRLLMAKKMHDYYRSL